MIRDLGRDVPRALRDDRRRAPDVVTAIGDFFDGAAETLRETDYADACPIATVALEVASTNEPLREATAEVFESWIEAATAYFVHAGIDEGRARDLSLEMLMLLEGAFLFSRASKTTRPMEIAGVAAVAAVREALPAGRTTSSRAMRD